MSSDEISKLAETLHPLERKVLPLISTNPDLNSLVSSSGLQEVEVMRAIQWMENKKIVEVKTDIIETIELDTNGKEYAKKGLPERRFLEAIKDTPLSLEELQQKAGLEKLEINVCIGMLKKKAAIDISKNSDGMSISATEHGKKVMEKEWLEDVLLKKLENEKLKLSDLSPEEKFAFDIFKNRKDILKTHIRKLRTITLTPIGETLSHIKIDDSAIDRLTPEMLKTGDWKNKKFRRYDVTINVPKITRGKRHFVNQATDYAKQVMIELGFKEMTGTLLNTSFWNFDALFTAQDHPAREMQDTFFIGHPTKGKLPESKIVDSVKSAHEDGGDTESTGWKYVWDPEVAKENVLRTHTTVLSAQTLARLKKEDWPAKFFAVGKVFRNETVDWSHLFEFNQAEGILVDPNANFRHLLGYLKALFTKMGFPKVRFRPAHFPYTEPSVEMDVFHPVHKQWVELGGAGIFRPEVTEPLLGESVPVLAWGPGFDRIMTEYFNITDLRDLYRNDLKQLRNMKEWMR